MDRRAFVFGLAVAPLYAKAPLQTFTGNEAAQIESLIDCIIPADSDPGAKDAGVLYYLDKQLAGPLHRFLPAYRDGLPLLQKLSPHALPELSLEARTNFLQGIEESGPPEAQAFFRLLVEHTMQGFYGAPENGGNRDEASWRMLHITGMFDGHRH